MHWVPHTWSSTLVQTSPVVPDKNLLSQQAVLPCTSLSWHSFSLDHSSLKKSPAGSAELGLPQVPPDAFILFFLLSTSLICLQNWRTLTLSFKQHSYGAVSEDRCMPVMTDRQHLCLHLSEHNMQPWMKDKAHTYSCQVALIHWQSHSNHGRCKYCAATNYKIVPSTPPPLKQSSN